MNGSSYLCVSHSLQEHKDHIKKVLRRLQEAGLKLKPSKCNFAQSQVDYLGHTLTPEGVTPNDQKIQAVKQFPKPTCCKEVQSFLGLVNFYRRHVPNLAVIARPLTALTRKDKSSNQPVPFIWDEDCEIAFSKIKELLISAPLLRPPDLSLSTFICGQTPVVKDLVPFLSNVEMMGRGTPSRMQAVRQIQQRLNMRPRSWKLQHWSMLWRILKYIC